jgi:hypothetical protein
VIDPSKNTTETFVGTVPVGGYQSSSFRVSRAGEYSVTLVSLNPPASVFVTVSFGTAVSVGCAPSQGYSNALATPGHTVLQGSIPASGMYCVQVNDQGNFTVPETYTIQVSHP